MKETEEFLYFLALNPDVKYSVPGVFFKIGVADTLENCLKPFKNDLPFNPIHRELIFYQIPEDMNPRQIEEQIRVELLSGNSGFNIKEFRKDDPDCSNEWLHIAELPLTKENIKLAAAIVGNAVTDRFMEKPNGKGFTMPRLKNNEKNYDSAKQKRDSEAVIEFTKTELFKDILKLR